MLNSSRRRLLSHRGMSFCTGLLRATALGMAFSLTLSACGELPSAGPSSGEITDRFSTDPKDNPLGVKLIDLTPNVAEAVAHAPHPSLRKIAGLRNSQPVDRIGPGDVLSVQIYEAGPGLFGSARSMGAETSLNTGSGGAGANAASAITNSSQGGTSSESLPRMQVDRAGRISVPYVGSIEVAGHTPMEVEAIIQSRLAGKAAQPQVVVNTVLSDTNVVFISGDVKESGRYPLSLAGENLLDMIALSGGPTHPSQDMLVKVSRKGEQAQTGLIDVQTNAGENIAMQPQDRVQVDYEPRTFLVFGAAGKVAQVPFDSARVSLAEAVARSGGLDDQRADPKSVFLFRLETPFVARALDQPADKALVPIIYHVNLRDPSTFFLLQQFEMHDKDLVYIANAHTVQLYKFLQLINAIFTPVAYSAAISQY